MDGLGESLPFRLAFRAQGLEGERRAAPRASCHGVLLFVGIRSVSVKNPLVFGHFGGSGRDPNILEIEPGNPVS